MSKKAKTLQKYLVRIFWLIVGAVSFFLVTFFLIWERSDGNSFVAYVVNGMIILIATTEDKFRFYYLEKRKGKPISKQRILSALYDYTVLGKHDLSSIKSSLYLFYIFALVTSHILMLSPQLDVSESVRGYFTTVGYSLIILIAVDKFINQFVKDDKRIKAYEEASEED